MRLKLAAPPLIDMSGGLVTIDIERADKRPVPFSSIRGQIPPADPLLGSAKLPIGVDLSGNLVLGDLAATKNTHFLVVGTTGSGKSEWLRSAIAGLLLANTPETLQLVLIDPKRNAFDQLIGSPFLHDGKIVYPDEHPVLATFEWLAEETDRRFRKLQQTRTDDLRTLIKQTGIRTPRIVCYAMSTAIWFAAQTSARARRSNCSSRV